MALIIGFGSTFWPRLSDRILYPIPVSTPVGIDGFVVLDVGGVDVEGTVGDEGGDEVLVVTGTVVTVVDTIVVGGAVVTVVSGGILVVVDPPRVDVVTVLGVVVDVGASSQVHSAW